MSAHLNEQEQQKEMREAQKWFAQSIQLVMDGKAGELETKMEDYLRKHIRLTTKDIIIGFKSEGKTLMHLAASSGHLSVLEMILSKVPIKSEVANLVDEKGFSPLINATISESSAAMNALLDVGAKVATVTNDGASALHFAAADGSLERMGILLNAGSDLKVMSSSGTPLHWAAGKGNVKAIRYLIDKGAPIESSATKSSYKGTEVTPAVMMAAANSSSKAVCELIEAGASVAHVISGDVNLLHVCSENNLLSAVEKILATGELGASLALQKTKAGNTPIELAAMHGFKEIVDLLLPLDDALSIQGIEAVLKRGPTLLRVWEEGKRKQEREQALASERIKKGTTNSVVAGSNEIHKAESIDPAENDTAKAKAEEHKGKGNDYFKNKAYMEAIGEYTEAIKLEGDNAIFWSNRSACYLLLDKPRDALIDAEVCRGLRPHWDKACLRLAKARMALEMYEDAAVAAFEGLKLDNSNKTLKELTNQCVKLGREQHQKQQEQKQGGK